MCLATFETNEVYIGLNWKKKYKSPTDYCFAIKHPRLQQPKSVKFIKFLCADDQQTLERWLTAMRIAKVINHFNISLFLKLGTLFIFHSIMIYSNCAL